MIVAYRTVAKAPGNIYWLSSAGHGSARSANSNVISVIASWGGICIIFYRTHAISPPEWEREGEFRARNPPHAQWRSWSASCAVFANPANPWCRGTQCNEDYLAFKKKKKKMKLQNWERLPSPWPARKLGEQFEQLLPSSEVLFATRSMPVTHACFSTAQSELYRETVPWSTSICLECCLPSRFCHNPDQTTHYSCHNKRSHYIGTTSW